MKFIQSTLISIFMLVALLAISSCSGKPELLDTIPANSRMVMTINAEKICSEFGIKFSETGADIPGHLKRKIKPTDDVNAVLDLLGRISASGAGDVKSMAMSVYDEVLFTTLHIETVERIKALNCPWMQWGDDAGGYATGTLGRGLTVVARDGQMWIFEHCPKAPAVVREMLGEAEKASIGSLDAIAQSLAADRYVNLAIISEEIKDNKNLAPFQAATWALIGLNVDGPRFVTDIEMVKGTGEEIAVEGMQPINDAVLSYVPAACNVAFAAGLTPRFNWDYIKLLAAIGGDFQTRAALDVAIPFLNSIDGTVMLAAAPANEEAYSDPQPGNWNFIIMAHMSREKIDQLLGMVRTMVFTTGRSPVTDKNGIMAIPQYGTTLYMGNVDGYFAVATFPFSNNRDNSLTPVMEGKEAAALFTVPSLATLSDGAPEWGIDIKGQFDGSKGRIVATLPGSEGSVLVNLLSLL
ncbi:MAG: hypothetical protein K2L91_04450 [Duncaniella sp.]|nr:hypothetical protein [Duncaniella sp.]MDE6169875.1 hypothetical protein [Duncaniella sp.]MDE6327759.1 hypothetical protein [Duncaniella sp.]